jgi:uncharacterized cupredoxin-like copper-binding protein
MCGALRRLPGGVVVAAALVLPGCVSGGCGGASQAATTDVVHVEIHHSHFDPSSLSLRSGETVRFVVHNADPIDHEFIVGDQATQDRHEHGNDDHHDGLVPGEISAPAETTVTTTYHLGGPGQILYGCHIPGHWAYGMRGVIRVSA